MLHQFLRQQSGNAKFCFVCLVDNQSICSTNLVDNIGWLPTGAKLSFSWRTDDTALQCIVISQQYKQATALITALAPAKPLANYKTKVLTLIAYQVPASQRIALISAYFQLCICPIAKLAEFCKFGRIHHIPAF